MSNLQDLIGETKLVRLKNTEIKYGLTAELYAKVESTNLTGSIKDRPAYNIIKRAEQNGLIKQGSYIIEATSGNMGISFACIGGLLGYKVIIVLPENMSEERKQLIKAYGGILYETKKELGMQGAIDKADELSKELGGYQPKQFENFWNKEAHYLTTGREILRDCPNITGLFAGIGTGGTISGIAEYLKENGDIKIFGIEPKNSPILNGGVVGGHKLQGIGANFIPKLLNRDVIDRVIDISDEDGYKFTKELCLLEGLFCGITSGACYAGAIEEIKKNNLKGKYVIILPDGGLKYMSTGVFD